MYLMYAEIERYTQVGELHTRKQVSLEGCRDENLFFYEHLFNAAIWTDLHLTSPNGQIKCVLNTF